MKQWLNKARKRLSQIVLVALVLSVRAAAHLMPYPIAVRIGGAIGILTYYLLPRDRRRAVTNLESVFPAKGTKWAYATARRTFMHLGKALIEVLLITPRRAASIVTFEGLENLRRALSLGKGVIYVTGHIGNWELMAGAVSQVVPVTGIGAPIEPETLNSMIVNLRAKMGATMIVRGRPGATRELIRVFRENRVLGILMDQDTDVDGTFVDFMGRQAWTPSAAAQMAIRFGAPVVFGYAQRNPDGRHTIRIEGPLALIRTGNEQEDVRANTAMFTKMIERVILENPEQWVWMHRRWRRQP